MINELQTMGNPLHLKIRTMEGKKSKSKLFHIAMGFLTSKALCKAFLLGPLPCTQLSLIELCYICVRETLSAAPLRCIYFNSAHELRGMWNWPHLKVKQKHQNIRFGK